MERHEQHFEGVYETLSTFLRDPNRCATFDRVVQLFKDRIMYRGGTVFTAGNGGSSANASHFSQDLRKACNSRSICLTDSVGSLTAYSNDVSYEDALSEQLFQWRPDSDRDMVLVLSGSGNSKNIVNLLAAAQGVVVPSVAIVGFSGGEVLQGGYATETVHVPSHDMRTCEDLQQILLHGIISEMEA